MDVTLPKVDVDFRHLPGLNWSNDKQCEAQRLVTFANWPFHHHLPSGIRLLKAGFFYRGSADEVQCYFCNFIKCDWMPGEKPDEVHRRKSPDCPIYDVDDRSPLVNRANVPIPAISNQITEMIVAGFYDSAAVAIQCEQEDVAIDLDVERLRRIGVKLRQERGRNHLRIPPAERETLSAADTWSRSSVRGPGPELRVAGLIADGGHVCYPKYIREKSRRRSFDSGFPADQFVSERKLAKSGFFYTGHNDTVICFQCGLILYDWKAGSDPDIAHARLGYACHFLKDERGQPFMQLAQNELHAVGYLREMIEQRIR